MASPFGKAMSPIADSNNVGSGVGSETKSPFQLAPFGKATSPLSDSSNALREFGSETKSPFQPADFQSQCKNPFQQSKLFSDGGSTLQTKGGSSFVTHASTSPFSSGPSSSLFWCTGNEENHANPFQQHSTPLGGKVVAWGRSPTMAHTSNVFGNKSTTPTAKVSPFAFFNIKEQEEKIPFQQPKAFSGGGLASKASQTMAPGSSIFGHVPASPFAFGKYSPSSNDHESKNPFRRSTFLADKSLASGPSAETAGSASFSFGKSSGPSFAEPGNVYKPERVNPFQCSPPESNRSTWNQNGMGRSRNGGGSPSLTVLPFGQPACYQNYMSPFASGHLERLACIIDP